jgi:glycosyltransferase involved in cell wall biosynthesis
LSLDGIQVRDGQDVLMGDGERLVEATLRLLNEPELSRTLSANGRKLIEAQYSWGHVAELYERLYAEVI